MTMIYSQRSLKPLRRERKRRGDLMVTEEQELIKAFTREKYGIHRDGRLTKLKPPSCAHHQERSFFPQIRTGFRADGPTLNDFGHTFLPGSLTRVFLLLMIMS